ncbi:MAG: hypothetical protein C3F13_02840 [Anaerolineales bacterium]|nr:MAG: hypothetical protein C3F13_02840 [Anaerolineales bacterium]
MEKDFYTVPINAYIFNPQKENPEEEVRQWALYELLSRYGYRIIELRTEVSVRIGSKPKKADIVIKVDNNNIAVIECKRKNRKDDSASQVKGYAERLGAEYAVWTDGVSYWNVARRVAGNWYQILDLPKRSELGKINYGILIGRTAFMSRFLYWHNSTVPGKYVRAFFSAVQTPANQLGLQAIEGVPEYLSHSFVELFYIAEEVLSPHIEKEPFDQKRLLHRLLDLFLDLRTFYQDVEFHPQYPSNVKGTSLEDSVKMMQSLLSQLEDDPSHSVKVDMGIQKQAALRISFVLSYNRELLKRYEGLISLEAVLVSALDAIMRYIAQYSRQGASDEDLSENQVSDIIRVFEIAYLQPKNMFLPTKNDIDGNENLKKICEIYWSNFLAIYLEQNKRGLFHRISGKYFGY